MMQDKAVIQIQAMTGKKGGKRYFRSLREMQASNPELMEWMHREFPEGFDKEPDEPSRRQLFKLMGASMALAGLTACRRPEQHILPTAKGYEDYVPSRPYFYSTAMQHNGVATGLLAEVNDGRPTKIEGNPSHPASQGAASVFHQASVLNLYDPDRLKSPKKGRENVDASWDEFGKYVQGVMAKAGAGESVRFLTERNSSPTFQAVRAQLQAKWPQAKWVEFEPASPDNGTAGAKLAFGQALRPVYKLDQAKVVFSLDSDFLGLDAETLDPIKGFTKTRRVDTENPEMSRLYMAESQFSVTGANADNRIRLKAAEVAQLAAELATAVGAVPAGLKVLNNGGDRRAKFVTAAAKDLKAAGKNALVLAGPRQPAAVHALAAAMNATLGAAGTTVSYVKPEGADQWRPQLEALKELAAEMNGGRVQTLVILGGNPVFNAPADLDFAAALKKVPHAIHHTYEANETAVQCTWYLPETHYLEAWGDARTHNGLATVQQPTIQPLFDGKPAIEFLALLGDLPVKRGYDLVRATWKGKGPAVANDSAGDKSWRTILHEGMVPGSEYAPVTPTVNTAAVASAANSLPAPTQGVEVVFVPSFQVWDGRYANNAWLQELPDPMTKVTWDNTALVSPATAKRLGVFRDAWDRSQNIDDYTIEISRNGRKLVVPVLVQPGHPDETVTVAVGYGRQVCGNVGLNTGTNVYPLRTVDTFDYAGGYDVKQAGTVSRLATTQDHHSMGGFGKREEDRPLVREASFEEYKKSPDFAQHMVHEPELYSLHEEFKYDQGYQWGMAIDLNACTGCNACVIACQAENNIPVVGKEQVIRGREMHWIRLDRYFVTDDKRKEDEPEAVTQPVACMHCENAPCETVCPVYATVHSPDGLNDMAYNRCVGTRYCANNCPYKVRRFNYFNYHKAEENDSRYEVRKMVYNPEVSARMRGVMEKCTYCTQRIAEKRIQARAEGRRPIRDGEIQTACQQTCPADAIVFGDINDPQSRVSQLRKTGRNYGLLTELNTRPRTTYLAKVRNPNPELA